MDRRGFLKFAGMGISAGLLTNCSIDLPSGMIKAYEDSLKRKENISRIYNELPEHVYIAETVTSYRGQEKKGINFGAGIILDGKYVTMDHIITLNAGLSKEVVSHETFLKNKKLETYVRDPKTDVAIFDLPNDLSLPGFPAKPSGEITLGKEVYILGNPLLSGSNIIKARISDLDGLNFKYAKDRDLFEDFRIDLKFGIDKFIYMGDSGSPCVSSDFELLGLAQTGLIRGRDYNGLGHILKIDNFTKHL